MRIEHRIFWLKEGDDAKALELAAALEDGFAIMSAIQMSNCGCIITAKAIVEPGDLPPKKGARSPIATE